MIRIDVLTKEVTELAGPFHHRKTQGEGTHWTRDLGAI